jgi:hypothetical protein
MWVGEERGPLVLQPVNRRSPPRADAVAPPCEHVRDLRRLQVTSLAPSTAQGLFVHNPARLPVDDRAGAAARRGFFQRRFAHQLAFAAARRGDWEAIGLSPCETTRGRTFPRWNRLAR